MEENIRQGAVTALLAEYEKAIIELQNVIEDLETQALTAIADPFTARMECKSIQSILTHVVSSGYSYCVYIRNLTNKNEKRPAKVDHLSTAEYKKDLEDVLKFTRDTFAHIPDDQLEELDDTKKIVTAWGKFYDIEQIMEHAIVHILRHRRQIEGFKIILKN